MKSKVIPDVRGSFLLHCVALASGLLLIFHSEAIGNKASGNNTLLPCAIQGVGFSSPYIGQTIQTEGVVIADLDDTSQRGFYIQVEDCDGNSNTSDGIFIYLGTRLDLVDTGDGVVVVGQVNEYYGLTEIHALPGDVLVLSTGNTLPIAVEMDPPFAQESARAYFESLEGMLVSLMHGQVVGPTDSDDRTWLVRADLGLARVFQDDPAGTGEIICADDSGLFEVTPEAKVGDEVQNLIGALGFSFSEYCMQLIEQPVLQPNLFQCGTGFHLFEQTRAHSSAGITVATMNLADLFDTTDDPNTQDTVLSQTEYQRRLRKRALAIHNDLDEPTVIAVQEVENLGVLQALAGQDEIQAVYQAILEDGPDLRGIDIALLYRTDQAVVLDYQVRQACTGRVDGLGPDGNQDVYNPQNALTCDQDGDGVLDGNRLFSRAPMIAHLQLCSYGCLPGLLDAEKDSAGNFEIWLILNHWISKTNDSSTVEYSLPRRLEQAEYVANLVQEIRIAHPGANLIVLGDLNDYPDSQPLSILKSLPLSDVSMSIAKPLRYSYIYHGVSGIMDYLLIDLSPQISAISAIISHINADYPVVNEKDDKIATRYSDHDPVILSLQENGYFTYLPVVNK